MTAFGLYRAVVFDSSDPIHVGRLRLLVRDLFENNPTDWAWPCFTPNLFLYTFGVAASFFPPAIGSVVWAAFEKGDPAYPIWLGTSTFPATVGSIR